VFTNLTPFVPLSFKGGGKRFIERGFTPLLPTLPLSLLREGGQGDRLLINLLWADQQGSGDDKENLPQT